MALSKTDQQIIRDLAQQHGLSQGAVEALWVAVQAGNGTAAQFNHPELGGMGQWMAGGMTMIGDFSNYRLQGSVAAICAALADHLRNRAQQPAPAPAQSQSQRSPRSSQESPMPTDSERTSASQGGLLSTLGKKLFGGASSPPTDAPTASSAKWSNWWPEELGMPAGSGSQNDMHYAYFSTQRRLALRIGNRFTLYDTQDHQINGVSQQQDAKQTVTFRSQKGEFGVDKLKKVRDYRI